MLARASSVAVAVDSFDKRDAMNNEDTQIFQPYNSFGHNRLDLLKMDIEGFFSFAFGSFLKEFPPSTT